MLLITARDKIEVKIIYILEMLCYLQENIINDRYLKLIAFGLIEDIREKITDENIFDIVKDITEINYPLDDFNIYFPRFKRLLSRKDGILSRKKVFNPIKIKDLRTKKLDSEHNIKKEIYLHV